MIEPEMTTDEDDSVGRPPDRPVHITVPVQVWADIDTGIAGMVRYLNTIPGVRTEASCQGTIGEGGPAPYRAYAMVRWQDDATGQRLLAEFDHSETEPGENIPQHWCYLHPREGWAAPTDPIAPAGAYIPWANAGGPDECAHGRAKGIACPECDRAVPECGDMCDGDNHDLYCPKWRAVPEPVPTERELKVRKMQGRSVPLDSICLCQKNFCPIHSTRQPSAPEAAAAHRGIETAIYYGNSECAECNAKMYGKRAFAVPTAVAGCKKIICEECALSAAPIAPATQELIRELVDALKVARHLDSWAYTQALMGVQQNNSREEELGRMIDAAKEQIDATLARADSHRKGANNA
jgi:hypothetical protein